MAFDELDGLQPNTQKPGTSKLGTAANPWDEVFASAVYSSGAKVPGLYSATVDFVAGVPQTITHNLNNANPIVQVYGSGLYAGMIPVGSSILAGTTPYISYQAYSGTASTIILGTTSGIAGAKVVILG